MDVLYLFVDGSFIKSKSEVHVGVVAIINNQIIVESYNKTNELYSIDSPHEELAIIFGLNLAKQIDSIKEINLFSDSKFLVKLLNTREDIKETNLYKNKKIFIKKIISLQNHFLNSNININIYWSTDEHTYGLKRAHNISRKWNHKEEPLKPVIIDHNIVINYESPITIKKALSIFQCNNEYDSIKKSQKWQHKTRRTQFGLKKY